MINSNAKDRLSVVPGVLIGGVFGLTANLAALFFDQPFWVGFLLHSIVGIITMMIVCACLWRQNPGYTGAFKTTTT